MTLTPVNSSQLHSAGHDPELGLGVKFHIRDCPRTKKPEPGCEPAQCTCSGGPLYTYPDASAEEHSMLVNAPSVGSHFIKNIKSKHKNFTKEETK